MEDFKEIAAKILKVVYLIVAWLFLVTYLGSIPYVIETYTNLPNVLPEWLLIIFGIIYFAGMIFGYSFIPGLIEAFVEDPLDQYTPDFKQPTLFMLVVLSPALLFAALYMIFGDFKITLPAMPEIPIDWPMAWIVFWLGFFSLPILTGIIYLLMGSGDRIDSSHQWTIAGTSTRVRGATEREVWEHENRNSGITWGQKQNIKTIVWLVILTGVIYVLLILPEGLDTSDYISRGVALLLGGLAGAGFLISGYKGAGLDDESTSYEDGEFIPSILAFGGLVVLVIMGLIELISFLVSGSFLFSINFLWIPALLGPLSLIVKRIVEGRAQKQYEEKQKSINEWKKREEDHRIHSVDFDDLDPLSKWTAELSKRLGGESYWKERMVGSSNIRELAESCRELIDMYQFPSGSTLYDPLFDAAEELLLFIIRGHTLFIKIPGVYSEKDFLLETAQKYYLYCINNGYNMNSELARAFTQRP